jgi:hypothetical protein
MITNTLLRDARVLEMMVVERGGGGTCGRVRELAT